MDETIEKEIAKTIDDGKDFVKLVKNYSKMEIVDKGSSILSTLILIIIIIAIGTIAVFCLCMAVYHWLKSKNNDPILSYSIIALALLFICTLTVLLKKHLIESPLIRMMNKSMSGKDELNMPDVKTRNDLVRQKSSLLVNIKKSGRELKTSAKDSFSPKRKTANGTKFDFNKLATYAVFLYKGIVWTNKVRRFFGGSKVKKTKKRR